MSLLSNGFMSKISAGEIGEPKREIVAPDPRPLEEPLEKPQPDSVPVPEKVPASVAHVVF